MGLSSLHFTSSFFCFCSLFSTLAKFNMDSADPTHHKPFFPPPPVPLRILLLSPAKLYAYFFHQVPATTRVGLLGLVIAVSTFFMVLTANQANAARTGVYGIGDGDVTSHLAFEHADVHERQDVQAGHVPYVVEADGVDANVKGDGVVRERDDTSFEAYLPHIEAENAYAYIHLLPSGELIAIWSSGSRPTDDAASRDARGKLGGVGAKEPPRGLSLSRLRAKDTTWSAPEPLVFDENAVLANPVVVATDHTGKSLLLLYESRKRNSAGALRMTHGDDCYDLWERMYPEQKVDPKGQSCYWKANTPEGCQTLHRTCARTCGMCTDDDHKLGAMRSTNGGKSWTLVDGGVPTPGNMASLRHDPLYTRAPECRGRAGRRHLTSGGAGCDATTYMLPAHFHFTLSCDKDHAREACVGAEVWRGPAVAAHVGVAFGKGDEILRGARWSLMSSIDANAFAKWDDAHTMAAQIADGHGDLENSNGTKWWKDSSGSLRPLPEGYAEPCFMRARDGRVVALMRSRGGGKMMRTESFDDGLTWTFPLETNLPSLNDDFSCAYLPNGNFVVVFNNLAMRTISRKDCLSQYKDECPGSGAPPLSVALSSDGGLTWPYVKDLQLFFQGPEYSFPSVTADASGRIHVVFSWSACRECMPMGEKYTLDGYNAAKNACFVKCRKLAQGVRTSIKYMSFDENWVQTPYTVNRGLIDTYGAFKGDTEARGNFSTAAAKQAAVGWWEANAEGVEEIGDHHVVRDADGRTGTIVTKFKPPPPMFPPMMPPSSPDTPPGYAGWEGAAKPSS